MVKGYQIGERHSLLLMKLQILLQKAATGIYSYIECNYYGDGENKEKV